MTKLDEHQYTDEFKKERDELEQKIKGENKVAQHVRRKIEDFEQYWEVQAIVFEDTDGNIDHITILE